MVDDKGIKCSEQALKYAWDWFEYHARQRMTAFNFFLILIGLVVAGYLKCVELAEGGEAQSIAGGTWWFFASAIGFFGALISVAFWFLDIRNAELVNCGRNTLIELEENMGISIRKDDESRRYLNDSLDILTRRMPKSCVPKLARYGTWLRTIMFFAAIVFLVSSSFALHQALINCAVNWL